MGLLDSFLFLMLEIIAEKNIFKTGLCKKKTFLDNFQLPILLFVQHMCTEIHQKWKNSAQEHL